MEARARRLFGSRRTWLSVLIALFGVLPDNPLALTHRWLYLPSGVIGLIMFGMTHFVGADKG